MFTNMFLKGTVLRDFTLLFVAKTNLLDSLKGFAKLFLFEKFLQKRISESKQIQKRLLFCCVAGCFFVNTMSE